jgi:hypothetical protein
LIQAFAFYLQGPKENRQVSLLLAELKTELLEREVDRKYNQKIDLLLEQYYNEWER